MAEEDDESEEDLKYPAQISIVFDELNHVEIGLSCFLTFKICGRTIRSSEWGIGRTGPISSRIQDIGCIGLRREGKRRESIKEYKNRRPIKEKRARSEQLKKERKA
jgi:hypothetical protein